MLLKEKDLSFFFVAEEEEGRGGHRKINCFFFLFFLETVLVLQQASLCGLRVVLPLEVVSKQVEAGHALLACQKSLCIVMGGVSFFLNSSRVEMVPNSGTRLGALSWAQNFDTGRINLVHVGRINVLPWAH